MIIGIKTMLNAVYPIFSNLCQEKAKAISTTIVNEQTKKVMENYSYDSIFEIDKDNSGNITEYIWGETKTDENGNYSFTGYIPGDYIIRFYYS